MFQEYVPCVARRSLRPRTTDRHQFERKGEFTEHSNEKNYWRDNSKNITYL